MIVIIDYGCGNLFSLRSSFDYIGKKTITTSNMEEIQKADKIILPGVGAFKDAKEKLDKLRLSDILINKANEGCHIMGICLGMQLLFEKSYEFCETKGLGLLNGNIEDLDKSIQKGYKIPQIGWNSLILPKTKHPIFKYTNDGDYVYFVHSYSAICPEDVKIAQTNYGGLITASCGKDNICGCQFHPEKSGEIGLNILKAFCEW